jgi:hypothetical protein
MQLLLHLSGRIDRSLGIKAQNSSRRLREFCTKPLCGRELAVLLIGHQQPARGVGTLQKEGIRDINFAAQPVRRSSDHGFDRASSINLRSKSDLKIG